MRKVFPVLLVVALVGGNLMAGGADGPDPPTGREIARTEFLHRVMEMRPVLPAPRGLDVATGDPADLVQRETCAFVAQGERSVVQSCTAESSLVFDGLMSDPTATPASSIHVIEQTPDKCCICEIVCWGGSGNVCWRDCYCTSGDYYAPGC